jgi:BolA protein
MSSVIDTMRSRLSLLAPESLDIIDESAAHAGHEGAKNGGHYRLRIVSAQFAGKGTVARHQAVYGALGDLMRERIHALSMVTQTPDEAGAKQNP